MNAFRSAMRGTNDCNCCDGLTARIPDRVTNRPGLSRIHYRVGTHSRFKETLLARLSAKELSALRRLKARDDDFAVALLDAWAVVGDILTFYQERIANESYLRTAVERLSVRELARSIGYELAPGVAATTYLAFTMDEAPGAPDKETKSTLIDAGTKVQSTPGPGEQAQIFETVEPVVARVAWNALKPRTHYPHPVTKELGQVVLSGTTANLRKGDLVAIIENGNAIAVRRVACINTDFDAGTSTVTFVGEPSGLPEVPATPLSPGSDDFEPKTPLDEAVVEAEVPETSLSPGSDDFEPKTPLDEAVVEAIVGARWASEDLCALADAHGWDLVDLADAINEQLAQRSLSPDTGVFVFRQRAALFGHNALKIVTYKTNPPHQPKPQNEWDEWPIADDERNRRLHLDVAYDDVISGGYVAIRISADDSLKVYPLTDAVTLGRSAYGLSGRSTRLELDEDWWKKPSLLQTEDAAPQYISEIRSTTVYAQSEQLPLADVPDETPVQGDEVVLNGAVLGLKPGQAVAISGERSDLPGTSSSEIRVLHQVWIDGGFTVLVFAQALDHVYLRNSVVINGNLALATHGETVQEVLGSGDARKTYQRFVLKQPPLTYTTADTPSGTRSTLEIRVNNLLWKEVDTLFGHGPEERVYRTRMDDQGRTAAQFGDGVTGARLPTGQDNVRARYRKGIGLGGLLKAGQLDLLMSHPLGVKGAVNPRATSGADDPEPRDAARRNAPLSVLTLDRAVSLQDYEDLARAFAGIAKARAIWTLNGTRNALFITVAGPKGAAIDEAGPTYRNLVRALRKAGDPFVQLDVASYLPAFFQVEGGITVHPDHETEVVVKAARERLRQAFSFDARDFGQPVALSEVMAIIQRTPGVVAVDIDALHRSDASTPGALETQLVAAQAVRDDKARMIAAELLTLDPASLDRLRVQS